MYGGLDSRSGNSAPPARDALSDPFEQAHLIRQFQVNFDELYVAAIANRIVVYEAKQLKPIDVLSEHKEKVGGLDVAQMLRNIVSYSRAPDSQQTTFMVHCLVDANHVRDQEEGPTKKVRVLQDEAVYMGRLKWQMTYKVTINAFRVPHCMSISLLGDFVVMGGQGFLALWTIDSLMDSFSQNVIYAKETSGDRNEVMESCPELRGDIVLAEICGSGRIFATLEDGSKTVKIWHNEDTSIQKPSQAEVNFRRFHLDGAPIESYELPMHRQPVSRFRFLNAEGGSYKATPSVLLTLTSRKAFVWVESLASSGMAFSCVQSFDTYFDANWLRIQRVTPRADKFMHKTDLKYECSRIFHSYSDKEKHIKKQLEIENPLGLLPSALGGNSRDMPSIDWLLLLNDENQMTLVQCKGLRNSPQAQLEFRKLRKISFGAELTSQRVTVARLLTCSMRRPGTYDDTFTCLTMSNTGLDLLKHTIVLPNMQAQLQSSQAQQPPKVELNAAINLPAPQQLAVTQMVPHPSLPLVALIYGDIRTVKVYKLEEMGQPSLHEPTFSLHGSYEVPPRGASKPIIDVQWVTELDQLLILTSDPEKANSPASVDLIASESSLKVIGLLGDKDSLQKEANRVLGQDPQTISMAVYQMAASFQLSTLSSAPKSLILLSSDVLAAQQAQAKPQEKICFAVISENGQSVTYETSFCVDLNQAKPASDQQQKVLYTSTPFAEGFILAKVLASRQSQAEDGKSASAYVLCLSQKKPEVQLVSANYRGPQLKPQPQLHLLRLTTGSDSSEKAREELFAAPGLADVLLEHPVVAKFSSTMLGVLVRQGIYMEEAPHLYLYDLKNGTYCGFLDLNKLTGAQAYRVGADFVFLEEKTKSAIAFSSRNCVHILYQKQTTWELLSSSKPLTNVSVEQTRQLAALNNLDGTQQTLISLINDGVLVAHSESQIFNLSESRQLALPQDQLLHRKIIEKQRSQSLFNPGLLAELFIKGYSSLVLKILLKMKELLGGVSSGEQPKEEECANLSDYLDMDLESLLLELKSQAEAITAAQGSAAQPVAAQPKKQSAFSPFDDFDESDSESEEQEEVKEEEVVVDDPKKKFKESAEELAQLMATKRAIQAMGIDTSQVKELVIFVLKFKNIFELDFYADPLANQLLRKVFYETEKINEDLVSEIMAKLAPPREENLSSVVQSDQARAAQDGTENFLNLSVKKVKPFSMEEFMAAQLNEPSVKSEGDLHLVTDWTSAMVCQALHSENQEVVMNYLADRFAFEKNLTWGVMRKICIPIWLKDTSQLKKYIEFVAKTEYRVNEGTKNVCKADYAAIWYTLLDKKSVLQNLYSLEVGHERFAEFFKKNFKQEKTRSIAQKNGMALIAKQKFHLACSFLLLGDKLDSAVQVALDRLKDPVLAILMCRIHDPEGTTGCLDKLLQKWFIDRGTQFNDPFLMNIGYWLKKEYIKSVNLLNPTQEESAISYLYKNNVVEFDLSASARADQASKKSQVERDAADQNNIYPLVSKRNYVILDLLKRLKQAPDVKRALNKAWANAKAPGQNSKAGGGTIFDDFWDNDSDSSEEKEEEENKEQISVNEGEVLRQAIGQTLIQRHTVIALLLIEENRTLVNDVDRNQIDRLSRTLLLDLTVNMQRDDSAGQSIKQLSKGLDLLARQLSLDSKIQSEQFLFRQLQMMGLLELRLEFLVEQIVQSKSEAQKQAMEEVGLQILEDHVRQLATLARSLTICAGSSLDTQSSDLAANEGLYRLVQAIESVVNCAIILGSAIDPNNGLPAGTASRDVLKTRQDTKSAQGAKSTSQFNGLNRVVMVNHGDEDVVEDSDEDDALAQINQKLQKPLFPAGQAKRPGASHQHQDSFLRHDCDDCTKEDLANTFLSLFRTKLSLVIILQTLAMVLGKHSMADKLSEEVNQLLCVNAYTEQIDGLAISEQQIMALKSNLTLHQLKQYTIKIKGTLQRNLAHSKSLNEECKQEGVARKPTQNVHPQQQSLYNFLEQWLRQINVARTASMLKSEQLNSIKLLGSQLLTRGQEKLADFLQKQMLRAGQLNAVSQYRETYQQLDESLQDSATYAFSRVLSPVEQRLITAEIEGIIDERYRKMGKSLSMAYFFSRAEKMRAFATNHELPGHLERLQDMQLGLTSQKTEPNQQVDGAIQNSLFSTGLELFKQRQESVVDICFDRTGSHDMMAMAIQARGMREISVIDTLVYRNRRDGGLEMIDEDQQSWSECLHRYEQIQQHLSDLKPKYDAIRAALYSNYYHTTLTSISKSEVPARSILVDVEQGKPQMWDMQPSSSYLKTYSNLNITHDDYANAVEAHPMLPIYLSGNAKGLICMWGFNQMADKSLNQWLLDKDTPPAAANPKKATVKSIQFNAYGDKFAALNTGGNIFVMNFDLEQSSKTEPLYSTLMSPRLSEHRLADMAFLDNDSILAGVSLRDKVLNVYDTLLPPKQSVVLSFRGGQGGNLMQVCADTHRILCFNSKPGHVSEYDLRKESEPVRTKQLSREEISAVALSPDQQTLVVGQSDGLVKFYDLKEVMSTSNTATVEKEPSINAFTQYGRKANVSRLRFHPKTGALFAASNVGVVKLLRLTI